MEVDLACLKMQDVNNLQNSTDIKTRRKKEGWTFPKPHGGELLKVEGKNLDGVVGMWSEP